MGKGGRESFEDPLPVRSKGAIAKPIKPAETFLPPSQIISPAAAGAVLATAGALYCAYYFKHLAQKPQLTFVPNQLNTEIVRRCPRMHSRYYPTPYLAGSHFQTIGGAMRGGGKLPHLPLYRQLLPAPDGGTVALDWLPRPRGRKDTLSDDAPTVIVLHGLTGGSCEPHVRWLLKMCEDNRWRAVLLNSRGCSDSPMTSPQIYTAGFTGDMTLCVQEVRRVLPNSPLLAVGVSLGASILTKWVAECGDTCLLHAAASVSNPMDLETTSGSVKDLMDPQLLWPYMILLSLRMYHYTFKHWSAIVKHPKLQHLKWTQLLQHLHDVTYLEDKIICPVFGFENRQEYYRDSSSIHHMHKIQTPMLFFQSSDDPFIRYHPVKECQENPYTILVLHKAGGHCSFLSGVLPLGHTHMTKTVVEYFEAVLEVKSKSMVRGSSQQSMVLPSSQMTSESHMLISKL